MRNSNYPIRKFGEVIHIKHGYAFKSEHFSDSGIYILLTPGNFFEAGGFRERPGKDRFYVGELPEDYLLSQGDVIVAMTEQGEGLLGSTAIIPKSNLYLHNQRLGLLSIKEPVQADLRYLFYLFNTDLVRQQIRGSSSGTKVRHTSPERIYSVQAVLPAIIIQSKIAAILSAYDDLIENNQRRIAILEKMAEEIYREWFVRMRFPGHEQVAFHKGIPEGWEKKRFDEFCQLKRGYDLPDAQIVEGIYPVIASTSIKAYHNEYKAKPPVITTGRSGSIGTVLLTDEPGWPLNTSLYVKDFKGNSPYYIYYTLRMMGLENFNSGAGVPTLNRNHLSALKLSVPTLNLQEKFDAQIKPIFEQVKNLQNLIQNLQKTRDRLLPRLLSGKLSVEDLDIQFPPRMSEAEAATHER